ncbi:unnamed protein product [Cylicocyclus nassatus]|uniref:ZP domain-containing protein n=1 Tax=Cylicocyclus nassatus TaxID=53992 RepID=A0AA36DTH4_CYLNA|nr:unnamed protein product [Cylicocyclus nassatus]
MLQPSINPLSTRSILLILSIVSVAVTVKPVWRTPVTNVGKNATSRTHRASNSVPQDGSDQKPVPYYTRTEDFKIPDYRPPKPFVPNAPNAFVSNFVPQTQFTPNRLPFVPNQFFQNFRPPGQVNGFQPQPFYPNRVQNFIPNPLNGPTQQWFLPPNANPYVQGASPIPPQGAYGPMTSTISTKEPMIPSVNPQNYKGTIPTQPAPNPEIYTTKSVISPVTDLFETHSTRGWYNPTSATPEKPTAEGVPTTKADVAVDRTILTTQSVFAMTENPFKETSTSTPTTKAGPSSDGKYVEGVTKDVENTEGLTAPPGKTSSSEEGSEEYTEDEGVEEGTTSTQTTTRSDSEQTKTKYFPRPASTQVYQPPGHLPEDFTQHIDVNFLKPNRTCTGPLCGIDGDKVSLYTPGKGDGSRGPTLLISNAAKGDAARLGYKPPNPKLISEITLPPSSTDYYNRQFVPDLSYRTRIPPGPHVFMPPQNFPAPPPPTLVPPAKITEETTIPPSYSPTAKTIAPPPMTAYYVTETATTAPYVITRPTSTSVPNTLPPFETTARSTESTDTYTVPEAPEEVTETQPPEQGGPSTPPGPQPWSPTYKTVPPATPSTPRTTRPPRPTTGAPFEVTTATQTPASTQPTLPYWATDLTTSAKQKWRFFTEKDSSEESEEATTEYSEIETETGPPPAAPTTRPTPPPPYPAKTETRPPAAPTTRPTPAPTYPTPPAEGVTSTPAQVTTPGKVLNRVRGKVQVICKEDGIEFGVTTLFPFTGEIFASDRKRIPSCFHSIVNAVSPRVFLPFTECGVRNAGEQNDNRAQYHMQVVVVIQQQDGTSTLQSFMAQCVHQKIKYNKQTLPRRIEEALEELHLVATKLEQKAPLPQVEMKIVVDEHHNIGPEVSEVDIGMPLAVQWKLLPESNAYGFHVKNCIVKDDISGIEHKMIDELGCSTDLSIFAHPHYDTYHDTASSHMWAFKVPDHSRLRIRCDVAICSDIASSTTNISSCAAIPSPPFCPDLITSPTNSILYDAEGAFSKRRRQTASEMTQSVRAALCTGDKCDPEQLALDKKCFDMYWVAASTGFSFASLIAAIFIHLAVKIKISRHR